MKEEYDYVSNIDPPTFPDGLDIEVFSFSALEFAYKNAKTINQREHVTHLFVQIKIYLNKLIIQIN